MNAFRKNSLLLSHLKNFVKIPGVQVFALMQKMLLSEHLCEFSISVSFLAKFCTPAYLRSSELSLI